MLTSFSEFKFFQSFRIPVEKADNLRFSVEIEDDMGNSAYVDDAILLDLSVTGFGFSTKRRIKVGTNLNINLQFKKIQIELTGSVVRAFSNALEDEEIIYGVELDAEKKVKKLLEQYIMSFSPDRLKESLIQSALKERYTKASEGFEMFSLLLSLFKDITNFGDKEGFIDNMLEEVVRILNAGRASIFLINPDTNELEAIAALGVDKEQLKFDYRLGIAGSVFTTGVALNIDVVNDKSRFNEDFDGKLGFETKSIVCYPIHNREEKVIGVIEVLNKRNQDRFSVEDEKTMKVLSLVFSSVFHNYNPVSEKSAIRRFSTPFDRQYAFIGKTPHVSALRSTIIKIKDLDAPVLVYGEEGVGKTLYSQILHHEGQRGLKSFEVVECHPKTLNDVEEQLWEEENTSKLVKCQGGTLVIKEIGFMTFEMQQKFKKVLKERRLPDSKVSIDVRIMATTSHDIPKMVQEGTFDPELYEMLCKAYVYIEPLRRRVADIDLLTDYFLKLECQKQGLLLKSFSPRAMEKLRDYDWPGNVKELKKCVERSVLYNPKSHIITEVELDNPASPVFDINAKMRMFGDLPHVSDFHIALKDRLAIVEREMILAEIKRNNGNKSKAAKEMGISREALRKKLLCSDKILEDLDPASSAPEKKAA